MTEFNYILRRFSELTQKFEIVGGFKYCGDAQQALKDRHTYCEIWFKSKSDYAGEGTGYYFLQRNSFFTKSY